MPNRQRAGPPARDPTLEQAEETLAQIRALWRHLFRNPFAEAAEHGLTGPQVTLMASLVSRGPTTLTELSAAVGMSHSTASGIVDRLQARGLVRRVRDTTDRRRTVIDVTDKVSRYVRELELGPTGRLAAALGRATAAERRAIREGLETLRALVDAERESPSRRSGRAPLPGASTGSPVRKHTGRRGSPSG